MSTDHERHLLGRARELADLGELAETVTGILGGARRAGLDPAALAGMVGAATALGAGGLAVYTAGRGPGPRHADEKEFLAALADTEDDMAARLRAAGQIHDQIVTAMDSALGALDAARAMHNPRAVQRMPQPQGRRDHRCRGAHRAVRVRGRGPGAAWRASPARPGTYRGRPVRPRRDLRVRLRPDPTRRSHAAPGTVDHRAKHRRQPEVTSAGIGRSGRPL
jgi:hypothetical protein